MNTFLRNPISKLYNAVSAPVAATRDALAERLQGVRATASFQERLKDIVEKEVEEEQQQKPSAIKEEQEEAKEQQQGPAAPKEQQGDDERYDTGAKMKLVYEEDAWKDSG